MNEQRGQQVTDRRDSFSVVLTIAETLLFAIALMACTLFLTASCPLWMKITCCVSLVDCGVEFAAGCKVPKGALDTKLTQQTP
jgi:hypothetical protein